MKADLRSGVANAKRRYGRFGGVIALAAAASLVLCAAPASSASNSKLAANIAKAKKIVAKDEIRPTSLSLKTPVGKTIPTGKKIVFISFPTPTAAITEAALTAEAAILGWTLQTINTDASPQEVDNAWTQILRERPDGVVFGGFDQSDYQTQISEAAKEGIAIAGCCAAAAATDGIFYYVDSNAVLADAIGPTLAELTLAESTASAPPAVLLVNLPTFSVLSAIGQKFTSTFKAACPTCFEGTLNLPASALGGTAPTTIVAYLRAHPDVKYVVADLDAENSGLPAALTAAGITGVKILGYSPTTQNLGYVAQGQETATVAWGVIETDWGMIDAFARKFVGARIQPAFAPPVWIMNKNNLPSSTTILPNVANVESIFKKLWDKG